MSNPDTVYVLSYSLIMLNTDAHNAEVKDKMTCGQFQRSNRGIDDSHGDLPDVFMEQLYNQIVSDEIVLHKAGSAGTPEDRKRQELDAAFLEQYNVNANQGVVATPRVAPTVQVAPPCLPQRMNPNCVLS